MVRLARCGMLVLIALVWPVATAMGQDVRLDVKEHTLSNGMRMLVVERHHTPRIACRVFYRVGGANDPEGRTGLAHLFEHMMFRGTRTIGTRDFPSEEKVIRRIDDLMARIDAARRSAADADTARLAMLKAHYQRALDRERNLLVTNEMDEIYSQAGATGLNAYTEPDNTVYMVEIPSNKLELFLWMDSDRMANAVLREFYAERDVVQDERRLGHEGSPYGYFYEEFNAVFYTAHPYRRPIVGWEDDVSRVTRPQAQEFLRTHYTPDNATLILVGDLSAEDAFAQAERYFGRIPRAQEPQADLVTREPVQHGERRITVESTAYPLVGIAYHTPAFGDADCHALDVMSGVLNGKSGRLYRDLVLEKDIALDVSASSDGAKYAGEFSLFAIVKPGHTHEEVEAALEAQLDRISKDPPTDTEMQRVRNSIEAGFVRGLRSNGGLADQLGSYDSLGDWHLLLTELQQLRAVTSADVARVAGRYLTKENRTIGWLVQKRPEGPDAGGDDR